MSSQQEAEQEQGFEFRWPVSRAQMEVTDFDELVESPLFATTDNGVRYLWVLEFYPKGEQSEQFPSPDKQPHVSLFLRLVQGSVKAHVDAKYQLAIHGGAKKREQQGSFDPTLGQGWPAFCLQSDVAGMELVEFRARVWLKARDFDVDRLFPDPPFHNIQVTRLLFEQTVLGDRSRGQAPGDVTLLVSNQHKLPCHRLFLEESSPVFQTLFKHRSALGETGPVHIDDIPMETLKKLLFFFYVDGMPEGWEDNALELLEASVKYGVESLRLKCEKQLAKEVRLEKAAVQLLVALEHDLELLAMKATQLLVDNWSRVSHADKEKLRQGDAFLLIIDAAASEKNVLRW